MWGRTTSLSLRDAGQPGVTPMLIVIDFVSPQLPFEAALVPKQRPIHILAPQRSDKSLDKSLRAGRTRDGFDLIDFEDRQIRKPPVKPKQWVII